MTDDALDPVAIYHNQTAILTWLQESGSPVNYRADAEVLLPITLPPVRRMVGTPCPYCGIVMTLGGRHGASKDHKIPRSKGGTLTRENRVIACLACNIAKNDSTLEEWRDRLFRGRDPRAVRVQDVIRSGFFS